MVGIGIGEMILIAGIALVVFGPEKFPDFAKIVLRTVRDLRGYVDEIQKEVAKEIKPIKRELDQMSKYDPEKYIDALSKDVTGEKKTNAPKPPAAASKPAADPTDRQDDSFDYDTGSDYDLPDDAPYGHQQTGGNTSTTTDAEAVPEEKPDAEPADTAENDEKNANGDINVTTEPVEQQD